MKKIAIIYEVFIFFLILFYLTVIVIGYAGSEVLSRQQIRWIDLGFIVYFLVEYLIRLYYSEHKKHFVQKNIFDLIALIPFDAYFRAFRLMRLIRLIRVVKLSKTVKEILKKGGLGYVFGFAALTIIWGSLSIFVLEKGLNPNIDGIIDALWWSVVTVTTVGYGDISPISTGGRVIASILMFVGIGLIGSITGSMAMYFSNLDSVMNGEDQQEEPKVRDDLATYVQSQISRIEKLSDAELEHVLASIKVLYQNKKADEKN